MMTTSLDKTVAQASIIHEFVKHPGFEIYKKAIEERINNFHSQWLTLSDEEAVKLRYKVQGLQMALDEVTKIMKSGEVAKRVAKASDDLTDL